MSIEIRPATEDDVHQIFRADGRAFGFAYSPEDVAERRPSLEIDRFRIAVEGRRVVGVSGAYSLQLTLPGGGCVPASGVTWVGVQATHRRRGAMTGMLDALHDDARDRGEPVAILTASESGIYGRLGYGVASHVRLAAISTGQARLRPEAPAGGDVVFADTEDDVRAHAPAVYERYRRRTVGEISRSPIIWDLLVRMRAKSMDGLSPAFWMLHRDGYACYRVEAHWNEGHPAHRLSLVELVATTEAARATLWRTLLDMDLVGEITTRAVPFDDPLNHWIDQPRAIRTTGVNDWLWVKPLDVPTLLGARTYGMDTTVVVEVTGVRLRLEIDRGRAHVTKVRTRPDLVADDAGLGAVLLGGVRPSTLVRAGRMRVARPEVLPIVDAVFAAEHLPFSQTPF